MEYDRNDADLLARKAEVRRRATDALFDIYHRSVDNYCCRSESPIEELMLAALSLMPVPLLLVEGDNQLESRIVNVVPAFGDHIDLDRLIKNQREFAVLLQQEQIGEFRVDFLIVAKFLSGDVVRVVVECDGHEFHERTKEQAERDRRRDRELQILGYRVLRFTGREIWRDALACSFSVAKFLQTLHDETFDSSVPFSDTQK